MKEARKNPPNEKLHHHLGLCFLVIMDTKTKIMLSLQFHFNELEYENITEKNELWIRKHDKNGAHQLWKGTL